VEFCCLQAKAIVRLPFNSQRQLAAVMNALGPEVKRQVGVRSKATLAVDGLVLILCVEAIDTVALRAALNAYLRWVNSTLRVLDALGKEA
jgi:KEOPS complex subunit Pcc1